jgi:regulatory protein
MGAYPGKDKIKSRIEKYCIIQDRCQEEVKQKLLSMGCHATEAEEWIVDLISEGFIQEERYARSFARGHFRLKHWGRILIRKHLQARRISEINIGIALDQEISEGEYKASALHLAEKKIRTDHYRIRLPEDRQKLYRYLTGKGYEMGVIQEIVKEILEKTQ